MKITPTGIDAFDEYLRQLSAGIRSLGGTDGRARARGTARKRVLKALRNVRRVMDERAPAIIERSGGERLTPRGRMQRLVRAGWVRVDELAADFAAAGVPVKRCPVVYRGSVYGESRLDETALWVPAWAVAIGVKNTTKLRQAKKSVMLQKAVLAEKALRESVMP